uniref:Uncharacterized protein n=1 Tax=viral metagenome TaxID=1070528 RepID=A0A6C0BZG4_9ZZZZ
MASEAFTTWPYIQYLAASDILQLSKYWSGCHHIHVPLDYHRRHTPNIQILPNVTEVAWSADGNDTDGRVLVEGGTEHVLRTVRSVLGSKVNVTLSKLARKAPDFVLWSGNATRFVKDTLPLLPRNSVVVSHGLFMQLRLCKKSMCNVDTIPNGGVLCLVCPDQNNKLVFVVRHCPTCDNVFRYQKRTLAIALPAHKGKEYLQNSSKTMCISLKPLRPLKLLLNVMHMLGVGANVYCSPLPRAVVTAAALVCDVSSSDLLKLQDKFGACPVPPTPQEVEAYLKEKTCEGELHSPYC